MKLDSVYANVHDIEKVLYQLRLKTRLKQQFQYMFHETVGAEYPVASVRLGQQTIELIGRVHNAQPIGGVIRRVECEADLSETFTLDLAPGSRLVIHPGSAPGIKLIEIHSPVEKRDRACMLKMCDADAQPTETGLMQDTTEIRLIRTGGVVPSSKPTLTFAGWNRMSVRTSSLKMAWRNLTMGGLRPLMPPFQVMPGRSMAMVQTPSGLILQLTEQRNFTMLPALYWRGFLSRLSGKPIEFHQRQL